MVYVMSVESAYVDKARKNEIVDLWHIRLGHVSFHNLKVMMKKKYAQGGFHSLMLEQRLFVLDANTVRPISYHIKILSSNLKSR